MTATGTAKVFDMLTDKLRQSDERVDLLAKKVADLRTSARAANSLLQVERALCDCPDDDACDRCRRSAAIENHLLEVLR